MAMPRQRGLGDIRSGPRLGPGRLRRQGHQDRLDIAAGAQPEPGAAVVEQVEFDIAAAAHQLMLPLLRRPGPVHPRPHDTREDREKGFPDGPDKGEVALPISAVEIIEKDPADAAWLLAMRQIEILVAPFLEPDI